MSQSQTILLTGATSFTGCHIARALIDGGHRVVATLTQSLDSPAYADDLLKARMAHAGGVEWLAEAPIGSTKLLSAIERLRPTVFVNHGASIKGYRDPSFDYLGSLGRGLNGMDTLIATLAANGARRFLHSGSIFEPGEGGEAQSPAISIYGVSKAMAWEPIRYFCETKKLGVSKIVIANPVGALENRDRLIPFFVKAWREGKRPNIRTPDLVRDNVPAPWLARVYAEEALVGGDSLLRVRRPSGYALRNEEFLRLFLERTPKLHGGAWDFDVQAQPSPEPLVRVNSEPCPERRDPQAETKFWNDWAASLA